MSPTYSTAMAVADKRQSRKMGKGISRLKDSQPISVPRGTERMSGLAQAMRNLQGMMPRLPRR